MYISIDVGGTNMRVALVDLEGEARIVNLESHPVPQDYQAGIEKLCGHIADLSAGQKIEGIGACFPGIIDKDNMVTTANNLPDWAMKPIKQFLQDRFGVPVKLLHDAQGAALGEAIFGAARHTDRFVYFIWGTGIGAADIKKSMTSATICSLLRTATTSWTGKANNATAASAAARRPGWGAIC